MLAVTMTLNFIATVYHLYWSIYEFDSAVHFLGGMGASLFFLWFYFFSGAFSPQKRSLPKFLLISILGTMAISFSWEIYELVFKKTMVRKIDYPYDTAMDLIMTFFGAITACFYGYLKELKKADFYGQSQN